MHDSHCPKCGAEYDGDNKTCASCGAVRPRGVLLQRLWNITLTSWLCRPALSKSAFTILSCLMCAGMRANSLER
ncbi:hypothetical protein BDY21DRAFT_333503 [Lineolata rhizophorae]|uniref:Zinc-ribbon domain-containing protein n=1 Tax=Lineolata rhizophorae TaxID=578093 RepID=A0A6A6PA42_9PEZI|nr:hypothetical protein BDY21DRAFT_333503 [Lineolata rhizophorae]